MYDEPFKRTKGNKYLECWKDYENAKQYKSSENLYDIIKKNERYYAGDHWKGINRKNLIPITLNFLEQQVDVKVSTIMANDITVFRKPDDIDANNEEVNQASTVFTECDRKIWERVNLDTMNEKALLQGAISGLAISYWYWNDDIMTGNDFVSKGDVDGELIRSANFYVSNPNCTNLQKQDWILIAYRLTVKQARRLAKSKGLSDDEVQRIVGDKEVEWEGSDKAYNEQTGDETNNLVTVLLRLEMNHDTGTVFKSKTIMNMTIEEPVDTKLSLYPVAIMPWKERDSFIYGNSEIQFIISNQQHINVLESLRGLHAKLQAMPQTLYNKSMITTYTNQIGAIIGVNADPYSDISKAIAHKQPANMGVDIDKSINNTLSLTREFKGINDNVIGASRAENRTALVVQQRAAGIPLESIKRRFYQYIEDIAKIWEEFYKVYYTETRKVVAPNGDEVQFVGSDYKDILLKTHIDVSASTQFAEDASINILTTMLEQGHITPVQYLERLPKSLIVKQEQLIEELGGGSEERKFEMMLRFMQELEPDDKMAVMEMLQRDMAPPSQMAPPQGGVPLA